MAEIGDELDVALGHEEVAQRFGIAGLQPFVCDDVAQAAAGAQKSQALLVEVDVEVRHTVKSLILGLERSLPFVAEKLLPNVGRVPDDCIESALRFGREQIRPEAGKT